MPKGVYKRTFSKKRSEAQKKASLKKWNSEHGKKLKKKFQQRFAGKNNPMYGKKRPDLAERNKKVINKGKDHWNWKGGISRNHQWNSRAIKWRLAIFKRDNFTCQVCYKVGGDIEAHHIKFWSKFPKLRYNINNGVTLCKKCHKAVHKTT